MKCKKVNNFAVLLLCMFGVFQCSSVDSRYVKKNYTQDNKQVIKHVVIAARAPMEYRDLDKLLLKIASDTIELKKKYLVHQKKSIKNPSDLNCGRQNGMIVFSIDRIRIDDAGVEMSIKCELFDCRTGEVIWHIRAENSSRPDNDDLENLILAYKNEFGENSELFSAVVFKLIRDIIEEIPDPVLTDEEALQKIELETGMLIDTGESANIYLRF